MNETRKAIIELIEPYMDKIEKPENNSDFYGEYQLVEWVLPNGYAGFYNDDLISFVKEGMGGKEKILNGEDFLNGKTNYLIYSVYFKFGEGLYGNSTFKIIKRYGHYDITAVEKFIADKHTRLCKIESHGIVRHYIYQGFDLPNKPLHLYTEEEDKQLLDLLLKLK